MDLFLTLFHKILPLYTLIALGFVAGRYFHIDRQQIATLVLYLVVPFVFFEAMASAELRPEYLFLLLSIMGISITVALSMFHLAKRLLPDKRANLIGYASSTLNSGYFGVPVYLAIAGPEHVGVFMFAIIALTVTEMTVGYYLLARSQYDWRMSIQKLVRLPILHGGMLGIAFNVLHIPVPGIITDVQPYFYGTYVLMGMMMIGLGLSTMRRLELDWPFIGLLFGQKFVLWPLLAIGIVTLDGVTLQWFDATARQILLLFSAMPLAANTVAFASQLNVHPEKAATAVLLSTILALFYIPVFCTLAL